MRPIHSLTSAALLLLSLGLVWPANAEFETRWVYPGTSYWQYPDNWNNGVPAHNEFHTYICNGGTAKIDNPNPSYVSYNLYVGYCADSTGHVELWDGELHVHRITYVGQSGTGTFYQNGGVHRADVGLWLGYNSAGDGTYDLWSGTLDVNGVTYVGRSGKGRFNHMGGGNYITEYLVIADNSSGDGVYDMTGGILDIHGSVIHLAWHGGTGKFKLRGGTVIADALYVHNTASSFTQEANTILRVNELVGLENFDDFGGCLELGHAGGSGSSNLTRSTDMFVGEDLVVGYDRSGTFTQSNCYINVGWSGHGNLCLGKMTSSSGTYNFNGGGLYSHESVIVGCTGPGTFNHTAGIHEVDEDLYIGHEDGGSGYYHLVGGRLTVDHEIIALDGDLEVEDGAECEGNLRVGHISGATGTSTLNGGILTIPGLYVGTGGPGVLSISDADPEITVSNTFVLGVNSQFNAVAGATIHMTGSTFDNQNPDPTDLPGLADLILVFEGGTVDVDDMEVGGEDFDTSGGDQCFINNNALCSLILGGSDVGQVRLVDTFDNQPDWDGSEVLYVRTLEIGAGSYLNLNGLKLYYEEATIDDGATIEYNGGELLQVGTSDAPEVPTTESTVGVTRLLPAAPNPFSRDTVIGFELATAGDVRLDVYDLQGRLVQRIADEVYPVGRHVLPWNGRDDGGRPMGAGVYFVWLTASGRDYSQRILLLK